MGEEAVCVVGETMFGLFVFSPGSQGSNPGPLHTKQGLSHRAVPVAFLSVLLQVDKHIRRLDADLARFEADLKDRMDGSDFESSGPRSLKSKLADVLFTRDCSFEGSRLNVLGTRW